MLALGCMPGLSVSESSRAARAQLFLKKWDCDEDLLNVLVIPIKVDFMHQGISSSLQISPEGTSPFELVTRSLRKLYALAARCEPQSPPVEN